MIAGIGNKIFTENLNFFKVVDKLDLKRKYLEEQMLQRTNFPGNVSF